MTPAKYDALHAHLANVLEKGLIRALKSPYGAAVFFVAKKDGSLRLVTDYRALNEVTIKNMYPLPLIDELFDSLGGSQYFSKIDLTAGYSQIRVKEEDIPKTAFRTKYGLFECVVLNFGMTNAQYTFVTYMNEVFAKYIGKYALVYLDDIIIYSPSKDQHNKDIQAVLDTLQENRFLAKPSKCMFYQRELPFLGHIISADGIKPNPEKVKGIRNLPAPRTKSKLRTFLGMIVYIKRFIPDCSALTAPLSALTGKDTNFDWTPIRDYNFRVLKEKLMSAPLLQYTMRDRDYQMETDASDAAISGVLRILTKKEYLPIAYKSRKLTDGECQYPIHGKETLAMVHCLYKWRCYLKRQKEFVALTDHKSLVYLKTQANLSFRQAAWIKTLQQ